MKNIYIGLLKDDDENIGHTHLLTEDQIDDCIFEIEKAGYSYFMINVGILFESDSDRLSDIIYDWR